MGMVVSESGWVCLFASPCSDDWFPGGDPAFFLYMRSVAYTKDEQIR